MSDSIQCIKCRDGCLSCQIDGFCFECESGKYMTENGSCVDSRCINSNYNTSNVCADC